MFPSRSIGAFNSPESHTKNVSNLQHRRWTFYLATIIVAVTGILMYFVRESHTSQLLERKVAAIQSHRADLILRTAPTAPRPSIFRPAILLFTKPIIFLSSLTNAFSAALLYLFAVAFPLIYAHYAWSRQKSTLIFLFIALGLLLSTLTRFHDRHATRKYRLANRRLAPEKGLLGLAIGAPVLAVGLWWFAWTIPGVHVKVVAWPASAVSLILVGYGVNEHSAVLPRYVLECHKNNNDAASAFSAMLSMRALLSAVFPLFTQHMFENLGTNPAGSVLAAIATASCLLPFILVRSGAKLRGSSASGAPNDGWESGQELTAAKKPRPKKTVRWGDETDSSSDGSETKSEVPTEEASRTASSDISTTETKTESESEDSDIAEPSSRPETQTETRDFANAGVSGAETNKENENESGDELPTVSKADTKTSESESAEIARVETAKSSSSDGSGGGGSGSVGADGKQKEEKREVTRVDDGDDGAAGFLGTDVGTLAVFPFL